MKKLFLILSLCAVQGVYAGSSPQSAPDANADSEVAREGERGDEGNNRSSNYSRGGFAEEKSAEGRQNQDMQNDK